MTPPPMTVLTMSLGSEASGGSWALGSDKNCSASWAKSTGAALAPLAGVATGFRGVAGGAGVDRGTNDRPGVTPGPADLTPDGEA